MPRIAALLPLAVIVVLAAAGCGGSSTTSSSSRSSGAAAPQTNTSSSGAGSPAPAAVSDAADPGGQLKFTKSSLTARAGKVTIQFTNDASMAHNFTLKPSNGAVVGSTATFVGGTKTLTVNLKPGTYTFFCSVPGHRQAGMQGTLAVT